MTNKPRFKKDSMFFHPEQKLFIAIDSVSYYEGEGKGWLYALRVYNHDRTESKPFKRYYEHKVMSELTPLKQDNAVKVLFGEAKRGRSKRTK